MPSYTSALPSKEERARKDPFADAQPVASDAPSDDQLAHLQAQQEKSAKEWQAAHEADAPRRARVLEMKGCLDGQCCYMVPGKMQAGPSVYNN